MTPTISSQTSIKNWIADSVVTSLRQYKALLMSGKLEVTAFVCYVLLQGLVFQSCSTVC